GTRQRPQRHRLSVRPPCRRHLFRGPAARRRAVRPAGRRLPAHLEGSAVARRRGADWWLDDIRAADLDPEAFQPDIMALARGEQPDRADAEILEDLRAKADLQPLILPLLCLAVHLAVMQAAAGSGRHADADRALAQVDD